MKTAIVTLTVGAGYEKLGRLTHPTMGAYARKIGADFKIIAWRKFKQTPLIQYEKLQLRDFLGEYDRLIYFDTDLIVSPKTPNLFQIVPSEFYGAVDVAEWGGPWKMTADQLLLLHSEQMGVPPPKSDGRHPNTGVMVLSKAHREMFADPPKYVNIALEQGWLNIRRLQLDLPFFPLPIHFNHGRFYAKDFKSKNAHIKHYQATLMGVDNAYQEIHRELRLAQSSFES